MQKSNNKLKPVMLYEEYLTKLLFQEGQWTYESLNLSARSELSVSSLLTEIFVASIIKP